MIVLLNGARYKRLKVKRLTALASLNTTIASEVDDDIIDSFRNNV